MKPLKPTMDELGIPWFDAWFQQNRTALEASMEEQEPDGDLMQWAKDAYYEEFEMLIVASRTGHGDERLPD